MEDCKKDVIEAHLIMINALRESAITRHDCHIITQFLFSTEISPMGEPKLLSKDGNDEVIILDDKNYIPDGRTALYNSLYSVLQELITCIDHARDEGLNPESTIALITDGEDTENGAEPGKIRAFIQEIKAKKILRSSVVVGLESSNGLNQQKLNEIKERLGFDKAILCKKSDSRTIREAFRMASQSLVAQLQ